MYKKPNTRMSQQLNNIDIDQQMRDNQLQNFKIGNSEIRIIGDKTVLIQVVKLLAYIRHAVQNNLKTTIKVNIGQYISNVDFKFDVNQLPVDDLITKDEITIS